MDHYPRQLSGGQQQRVAIGRALVTDPTLLVADEPTGDLDRVSAEDVLVLMERLSGELAKTIIMVTHDPRAARRARRIKHWTRAFSPMLWKLLYRNAFRHKLRALLTVAGVAIAVLAFGLLSTLVDAWYAGVSAAAANRLIIRQRHLAHLFPAHLLHGKDPGHRRGQGRLPHELVRRDLYRPQEFLRQFRRGAPKLSRLVSRVPSTRRPEVGLSQGSRGASPGAGWQTVSAGRSATPFTLKGTIYAGDWPSIVRGIYEGRERAPMRTSFSFTGTT